MCKELLKLWFLFGKELTVWKGAEYDYGLLNLNQLEEEMQRFIVCVSTSTGCQTKPGGPSFKMEGLCEMDTIGAENSYGLRENLANSCYRKPLMVSKNMEIKII